MAFAIGLLALAACSRGTTELRTEQRGVDAFHSIDLHGAADATVEVGTAGSVTLVAEAEALKTITTHVRNGMLTIENRPGKHWLRGPSKVEIHITLPTLNALAMNGAGNVTIAGVNGPALALALQGAGNLTASGQTTALNARISGAGNMNLGGLISGDTSLTVNGAGNLSANVTGSLKAAVNGVGSITYAGQPQQVESQISGIGRIMPAPAQGT